MKKVLFAILPCALALTVSATPVLAASGQDCDNAGTSPRTQILLNFYNITQSKGNSQIKETITVRTNINQLISQLLSDKSCARTIRWEDLFCLTPSLPDISTPSDCPDNTPSSDASEPDVSEPDASEPDTSEPDASEPDASEPDASEPDASEPDASEPNVPSQPGTSSQSDSSSQPDASSSDVEEPDDQGYRAFQKRVVELVNAERAKVGLAPLSETAELSNVATAKSKDMATRNYFSHTSPTYGSPFEMLSQFGISYTAAGENIAMGQTTPEQVMQGWMNSEGHRANILNSNYTQIGVGIAQNAQGRYFWTQTFLRP